MTLTEHARTELELANMFDEKGDFYGGMAGTAVMELIELFAKQGHSGMSAGLVRSLFTKLANYEPLGPLTGEDDEWSLSSHSEDTYQNKRQSAVFKKGKDGKPYYIEAIVWRTQKDVTYSGSAINSKGVKISSSQHFKEFPFVPKTFVVDVIEEEVAPDDWEFTIKDEDQLKEIMAYYEDIVV